MEENTPNKPVIKRIGGYLHKLIPIVDSTGKIINHPKMPMGH